MKYTVIFFITICIAINGFSQFLQTGKKYKIASFIDNGKKNKYAWFTIEKIDSAFQDHFDYYFVNGKDTVIQSLYWYDSVLLKLIYSEAQYLTLEKKFGVTVTRLIMVGRVWIGMSEAQAKASWGEPDSINTTTTRYSVSDQWVYDKRGYLYFENGKLTTIQD